jgi:hypothetical protein
VLLGTDDLFASHSVNADTHTAPFPLDALSRHHDLVQPHRVQLEEEVEALSFFDPQVVRTGQVRKAAADLLSSYGHEDAAAEYWERVLQWMEQNIDPRDAQAGDLLGWGQVLISLGRHDEARPFVERFVQALAEVDPNHMYIPGTLGLLEAHSGNREVALRIAQILSECSEPFTRGMGKVCHATILAQLGDLHDAVVLLRQARENGYAGWYELRRWPSFNPLRGYSDFEEFIRPKG